MNFSLLQSLFQKDEILPELQDSINSLCKCISARRSRSSTQLSLIDEMLKLIHKEAPRFEKPVSYALDPYRTIALNEQEFALAEERFKDDLLDIVERYRVIQRHQNEYSEILQTLHDTNMAINHAKIGAATEQTQIQADEAIASAKAFRIQLICSAKQKTKDLIEEKQKFARFKVNRLTHAWQQYSSALQIYGTKGAAEYERMATAFTDIRKQISDLCAPTKEYSTDDEMSATEEKIKTLVNDLANPFEAFEAQ